MTNSQRSYSKADSFVPFSNGTEHLMWEARNCRRGEKGCRRYRPEAATSKDGCPIEVAVAFGAATDGQVPCRIGLRGAFLEPGAGGRLVRSEDAIPACPEYKGYDEPDDRPRRGPRPSDGQIDLLDPRNAPTPERVHA